MCLILYKQNGNLCTQPTNWMHSCITSNYQFCVLSVNLHRWHKLSCRSQVYNGKKIFLKAFSRLRTSESLSELDWSVRLHKFWQVISTFLYPSGATRIKCAADAFNFVCGILQTKQTNYRNVCQFASGKSYPVYSKFCGAIKKNWWDTHSSCLCFVAQLWTENGNLKMMEQENSEHADPVLW